MLPESFLNDMRALLKDEFADFECAFTQTPTSALRVNALRKGACEASRAFLGDAVPWEEMGYYVLPGTQPGKSIAHAAGAFYIQDASAMAAVAALDPKPGETVLDLCAAPGGKSTQIAARMQGQGALVSNEYVKSRALILKGNMERMGVVNACVTNAPAEAFARLGEHFDAILVDAPCSGEGMFRRDPNAIGEWSPAAPMLCAARQAQILDQAAKCLKSGGRLVYSTCTFNETENEGTVRGFLMRHPQFEPMDFSLSGAGESREGCLRLWPHKIRGEGHFVCRLRKKGNLQTEVCFKAKPDKDAISLAQEAAALCLSKLPEGEYVKIGNEVLLRAPLPFDLKGVYTLSCGLALASLNGKTLQPAHALAMAAGCPARASLDLSEEDAAKFLQGEELSLPAEHGWLRLTYRNLPLGWGKSNGESIKNHLPKGLRLRGGHAVEIGTDA